MLERAPGAVPVRWVRALLVVLILHAAILGCTKSVRVPDADIEKSGADGLYRIKLVDKREYRVEWYVANDSTLVINRLQFPDSGPETPFTIPRSDVASVEKLSGRHWPALVVIGLVAAIVILGQGYSSGFGSN